MKTKIIGIKQFRENISTIWKEAQKNKIKYIIMYHSKPIFELNPLGKDELIKIDAEDLLWLKVAEKSLDFWNHPSNDVYEKLL